jgi:hypothetical protein
LLQLDGIAVYYDEIRLVSFSGGEPSDMVATLDAFAKKDIDPGNYICGIGSLQHAPLVLRMIQENKLDGKVILYSRAHVQQLKWVDYWDKEQREATLK